MYFKRSPPHYALNVQRPLPHKAYPLLWEKSETTPSNADNQTSFAALSSKKTGEDRPSGTPKKSNDLPLLWSASVPHPTDSSYPPPSATASPVKAGGDRSTGTLGQSNVHKNTAPRKRSKPLPQILMMPSHKARHAGLCLRLKKPYGRPVLRAPMLCQIHPPLLRPKRPAGISHKAT